MTNPVKAAEPPTIYLVRHGETDWTLTGQHTGTTDLPLTARGESQARTLAPVLQGIAFAHVFASPLQRARQTCALAGLAGAKIILPDLSEWNYGEYEGRRSIDIRKARPGWSMFRDGCPGGETPDQIASRADRLIARLGGLTGNIALFSHGHFGCSLAVRWIDLAIAQGQRLRLDTASLGILTNAMGYPRIRTIGLWNYVPGQFAALAIPVMSRRV